MMFNIGDRVRLHDGGYLGTVMSNDENGSVMVHCDNGGKSVVRVKHLDAAEPDAPQAPKGMTLDDAKAHVAQANIDRPMGLSWGRIESMQGGKLTRLTKTTIHR